MEEIKCRKIHGDIHKRSRNTVLSRSRKSTADQSVYRNVSAGDEQGSRSSNAMETSQRIHERLLDAGMSKRGKNNQETAQNLQRDTCRRGLATIHSGQRSQGKDY